ncbi:MAG: GNAT family N-acetyltransferase [Nitrososphaeraceae archaeon]|nr:GNAT family N-acetyltransferase [Nitrososphaeraceae archaeon]
MSTEIIKAGIEYKREILELVVEFYGIDRKDKRANTLKGCIAEFLNYPKYGSAFIIKYAGEIVGYVILAFGFSFEYGGRDSFIDEFYIKPEYREKGIGGIALDYIIKYARTTGIKAIHLEVKEKHKKAERLYIKKGFKEHKNKFMSLTLS